MKQCDILDVDPTRIMFVLHKPSSETPNFGECCWCNIVVAFVRAGGEKEGCTV